MNIGGIIRWKDDRREYWEALELARQDAQNQGYPAKFPYIKGAYDAVVMGHGTGRGKESHMAYWIQAGPGGCVWVQIDPRRSTDRRLYNLRIRITGRACLLLGLEDAYGIAVRVVEWLGGSVSDTWVKGGHICLDLPGVAVAEFAAPFRVGQFVTTAKRWTIHDSAEGCTGFTVGRSSTRLRLNVYDKLRDIATNHDPVYEQAYIDRRCGGERPEVATRVEYQVGREWLAEYGLDSVRDWFEKLPELVQKVTAAAEDSGYPFFRMTAVVPDRANKNQKHAGVFKLWASVVETFRRWVGEPVGQLAKIERERINPEKAVKTAVAYLSGIAARWGRFVETADDLCDVLREGLQKAKVETDYILDKWESYARKAGTLRDLLSFNPAQYDPTGKLRRDSSSLFDVGGELVYVPF